MLVLVSPVVVVYEATIYTKIETESDIITKGKENL